MSHFRSNRALAASAILVMLLISSIPGRSSARVSPKPLSDPESSARSVVSSLVNGQYNAIVAQFSPQLRRTLPAGRVAQLWQAQVQSLGAYKYDEGVYQQKAGGATAVLVRCKMEQGSVDVEVTYLDDGTIGNLTIGAANFARHIKPPT